MAFIAKVLAIVSMTLYVPLHLINSLSDYLFQYSGCSEWQEQDEDEIIKEMENNEEKEDDYE